MSGAPNGWGDKRSLIVLAVISAVTYLILVAAARNPRLINIPFAIDRDDPRVVYILRSMASTMKAILMLAFFWIIRGIVDTANGRANGIGVAFLPVVSGLILVTLVVYSIRLKAAAR